MSTVTLTVTSNWTNIFNIDLQGYYSIYVQEEEENNCKGYINFLENGSSISGDEISVGETRGIDIKTFLTRRLPMSFSFYDSVSRIYEIRKNNGFLEIRLISGSDIIVRFTLFSIYPDKDISYNFRENKSNRSDYYRLGSYTLPKIKRGNVTSVSWMDSDVTSYTLHIVDRLNKTVLLETTLNNTVEGVQDLGSLGNLPGNSTQIDISVKKNGGTGNSKIYIESLTISYN